MKTLLSILNESEGSSSLEGSVMSDQVVALMSGRPSQEIKSLKGRASSDPAGLLRDVGINNFPSGDSKIKNLEEIFAQMISGKNVSKDSPAKNFATFFDHPERVIAPNKTSAGLLIKLTSEAKNALGQTKSTKASLRIFSFWFASIVSSINNTKPNYFNIPDNNFKFQFATGEQAMLIYVSSRKSWKDL